MKLLSQQETKDTVEEQARKKSAELVHIEELLLRKKREIEQLQELRTKEKDNFARQVEDCFVILDSTRDEIRGLEERKRELLKPVDGILDEAHEIYERAEAEKRRSSELFESAEVKMVESKQVFTASSNLAKALVAIVDDIDHILTLPTNEILKSLRDISVYGKNLHAHAKEVSSAADTIKTNTKHAVKAVEEEKKTITKREEDIKKEKKHIASQQAAIRASLGK